MRRANWAAAALAGGAIAAGALTVADDDSAETAGADTPGSTAVATTTISRRDLVDTAIEDGTLGYADTRTVGSSLPGTVTWLPAAGRVIRPDQALMRVDESPVILMDGRVPAYRPLGPGVASGLDVRQLERTLRTTGYDPDREIVIDRAWDAATTASVLRWQDAHDLAETGAIEPGRIVFLPGARRIASVSSGVGAPNAGGEVMNTTSTRRRITVRLDTTKSELARRGARVRVELPSENRVPGRITSVGKVAMATRSEEKSAESSSVSATIEVKIRLSARGAGLDQAPVTVTFEKSRRKEVLAIPVTALVARPGGRFAVQIVEAGEAPRVVEVDPGLYASGYVEISGGGLRPGQRVTNAAVQ